MKKKKLFLWTEEFIWNLDFREARAALFRLFQGVRWLNPFRPVQVQWFRWQRGVCWSAESHHGEKPRAPSLPFPGPIVSEVFSPDSIASRFETSCFSCERYLFLRSLLQECLSTVIWEACNTSLNTRSNTPWPSAIFPPPELPSCGDSSAS